MSTASPSVPDLELVPVDRLAALLRERVQNTGTRLLESLGRPGPPGVDLDPAALSEGALRHVAGLVDDGDLLPERVAPDLDVRGRRIDIGDLRRRLRWRRTVEDVCRQYLRLVYALRELPTGTRVPVRRRDIDALSDAVDLPYSIVRTHLWREMEHLSLGDDAWTRGVRAQLVLPAAGLAVSAAAIGGFELARRSGSAGATSTPLQDATGSSSQAIPSGADLDGADASLLLPTRPAEAHDHDGHTHDVGALGDSPPPLPGAQVALPGTPAAAVAPMDPQDKGEAALELIAYDWQTSLPDWSIEFSGEVAGRLGYAFFHDKRIEIYVRDSQSVADVAEVLAHELGHAVDITLFDGEDRDTWLTARNLGSSAWWPEPGARSDFASGAGDWAESFAHWLLDDTSQSELGGEPTAAELAVLEDLVYGS